jgi:hypothetical protein
MPLDPSRLPLITFFQAQLACAVGVAAILDISIYLPDQLRLVMELVADPNFDDVDLLAQLIALGDFPACPYDRVDRWWGQLFGLPFTFPSPTVGECTFVQLNCHLMPFDSTNIITHDRLSFCRISPRSLRKTPTPAWKRLR